MHHGIESTAPAQFATGAQPAGMIQSLNPASGEVMAEFPAATADEVCSAISKARAAQVEWSALSFKQRAQPLRRFKELLLHRYEEVASLITRENGKPLAEALVTEVFIGLDLVQYYLTRGERLLRRRRVPHSNLALKLKRGELRYEPLGVVGIIAPWNYPFMLALGTTVPGLLAGNAVVLKPSEFAPAVGLKLQELMNEAGVPEGIFTVLLGDGATGAELARSPLGRIVFIGSVATGRKVAAAAAQTLTPVTLELGGNDAMIVLSDANLEYATSGALWGRYMNCGQSCVAAKRLFVEQRIFDEFVERLVGKVKSLRLGKGEDPNTDIGPMIRERQVATLENQLHDAVDRGARVLCGGKRRPDLGPMFFEPAVLVGVTPEMRVLREETFGPVLPVIPVKDADEAMTLANASEYGLSATIWTRNIRRGRQLANRLTAGSVLINDVVYHVGLSDAPYGGMKGSGLGRTHGPDGILEMVQSKLVESDSWTILRKPWWFHYSAGLVKNLKSFLYLSHQRSIFKRLSGIPGTLRLLRNEGKV